MSGIYITIFTEGSAPGQDRSHAQLKSAEDWAAGGILMDILEGIAIAIPGELILGEYIMSLGDLAVTGRSCYLYGESYFGKPDPSLPNMLVVNQDMIITGTDFGAPIAGGLVASAPSGGAGFAAGSVPTDMVTTGISFFYDIGRITGKIPNFVSAGWTLKGDLYILIYP